MYSLFKRGNLEIEQMNILVTNVSHFGKVGQMNLENFKK